MRVPALDSVQGIKTSTCRLPKERQTLREVKDLCSILEGKENDPDEQDSVLTETQLRISLTSPIRYLALLCLGANSPIQVAAEMSVCPPFPPP